MCAVSIGGPYACLDPSPSPPAETLSPRPISDQATPLPSASSPSGHNCGQLAAFVTAVYDVHGPRGRGALLVKQCYCAPEARLRCARSYIGNSGRTRTKFGRFRAKFSHVGPNSPRVCSGFEGKRPFSTPTLHDTSVMAGWPLQALVQPCKLVGAAITTCCTQLRGRPGYAPGKDLDRLPSPEVKSALGLPSPSLSQVSWVPRGAGPIQASTIEVPTNAPPVSSGDSGRRRTRLHQPCEFQQACSQAGRPAAGRFRPEFGGRARNRRVCTSFSGRSLINTVQASESA